MQILDCSQSRLNKQRKGIEFDERQRFQKNKFYLNHEETTEEEGTNDSVLEIKILGVIQEGKGSPDPSFTVPL